MQCIQNMFFTNNFKQKCVILNKKKWRKHGKREKQLIVSLMLLSHSDIICDVTIQRQQHGIYLIYIIHKQKLVNHLTPMSDQDRISPYNINTISNR